jgi:hypothetical protein
VQNGQDLDEWFLNSLNGGANFGLNLDDPILAALDETNIEQNQHPLISIDQLSFLIDQVTQH